MNAANFPKENAENAARFALLLLGRITLGIDRLYRLGELVRRRNRDRVLVHVE